ncbi:MAG: prepilin-type N-terminal cleavage/methylation domain-containing protein [Oscillospiraceae bacterium]|nr:prepilin-type N-terminal cleavage/methylation domain-containing protein [Oscillospiraceae bacterium]
MNRGFSLMEMLITTLILSLVMVIVTSGVAVAQKLYRKTMAKADAQMILSQIERYLRDDLSFADECETEADGKTVKRYHKNGFWYALANGPTGKSGLSANFLYKTFSATGESENTLYESLSASKSDRLEDIYVSVPVITYDSGENRFYVSGLRVMLDETTVIAGADSAQSGGTETPYLIISALNQVKVK